ncbi:MAG: fumarate reductase subunit FrdD, partial [Actinomycetota bacterium]
ALTMDRGAGDELSLGDVLDWSDAREVKPGPPRARPRRESRLLQLLRPEPMFWGLFSTGGFVAALVLPIAVAILGLAFPVGLLPRDALSYERVADLVRSPLAKLFLLGLVSLPLFHWAHRFRYAVHHQFGVHGLKRLVAVACYGTALALTAFAVQVLLRI